MPRTYGLMPQTQHRSMRRRLPAVCWFRHRRGGFVILKYSGDFAEEPLLFLRVLRIIRVLPIRRLARGRLRLNCLVAAKDAREEAFHPLLRVAGVAGLGPRHESGHIIVRAVWSRQTVRD